MSSDTASPIAQLAVYVERCIRVRTIAAICGPAGVGKTEMVRAIARKLGIPLYTLIGSLADPTDVNGFPTVSPVRMKVNYPADSEKTVPVLEFAPRDFMVAMNKTGGIIFLDEFNCAPSAVLATFLHLITQWQAGGYDLDPAKVAFVVSYNPADEAINGTELGFPITNRLTHFQFPVSIEAAREWTMDFPGYWGAPKEVSFGGVVVPENLLAKARSSVAGYIRANPHAWHQQLWEEAASTDDKKDKSASVRGKTQEEGAVTPRAWERVTRHMALAAMDTIHAMEVYPMIIGEIGPGQAASFQAHLREITLPDPEAILADHTTFNLTGRIEMDFATVVSVANCALTKLTPNRLLAALEVANICADEKAMARRPAKARKEWFPAIESGAAAIHILRKALALSNFVSGSGSTSPAAKALFGGMTEAEKTAFIAKVYNLLTPFNDIRQEMKGVKAI